MGFSTTSTLWVDTRYQGTHGIARYSREVLSRIPEGRDLGLGGNPTSPLSLIRPGWRKPSRNDLIYSPGFATGFSRARQLLTVHDLIHLRTLSGWKRQRYNLYYDLAVKRTIRASGHVFTVSQTSADDIAEWLNNDDVHIHNTGNGCSAAFTREGPRHEQHEPYFIFVGNLKPHKNFRVILEALRHLPEFKLLAVTADSTGVMRLANAVGVVSQVQCRSGLSDEELATYYRGAKALIIPSILEGFGLPAVEAIRCGTNVIYYAGCKSIAEICAGKHFTIERPDDHVALADAMDAASKSAAKPVDTSMYSWDAVADKARAVIRAVNEDSH